MFLLSSVVVAVISCSVCSLHLDRFTKLSAAYFVYIARDVWVCSYQTCLYVCPCENYSVISGAVCRERNTDQPQTYVILVTRCLLPLFVVAVVTLDRWNGFAVLTDAQILTSRWWFSWLKQQRYQDFSIRSCVFPFRVSTETAAACLQAISGWLDPSRSTRGGRRRAAVSGDRSVELGPRVWGTIGTRRSACQVQTHKHIIYPGLPKFILLH